jgi:hypothetical protein
MHALQSTFLVRAGFAFSNKGSGHLNQGTRVVKITPSAFIRARCDSPTNNAIKIQLSGRFTA